MSTLADLVSQHQDDRIALGNRLGVRLMGLWRTVPLQNLDAGWNVVAPQMVQQVTAFQRSAAVQAVTFSGALDSHYGYQAPKTMLNVDALTNVMGDGREVAPALYGAVTNTKTLIGGGVQPARAFESAAHFVAVLAQAAIQDMGRNADRAIAGGKQYTRYIRVANGSCCSRCAILVGMYSAEEAFRRHVSCQCSTVAITESGKVPKDIPTDPQALFDSLSKAEQDRRFTNAGAEAIRAGADPVAVVNARRGAYGIGYSGHSTLPNPARSVLRPITIGVKADGTPLRVYATVEGTTARGAFGRSELRATAQASKDGRYRRTTTVRLLPEQIVKMAGGNPERMRDLLTKYGYIN